MLKERLVYMNQEYVIIDLETTGLDIQNEAIIEIAAVRVRRGLIMDQFSTLIACDKVITPEIEALTGISNEMLEGQPELSDVLPMLIEFIGDADIVAHNAAFDSEFLHRFWPDDRVWIDTITMTQIAYPDLPSYALTNLSVYLNLEHTQAHRALGDALATAQLFVVVEKELDKLSPSAKEDIMTLLEGDDSPLGTLLRRKCASFISSSTDDDNKKPIKQRPAKKSGEIDEFFRINTEQIKSYLGEDSLYRDRLPGFEE
ncbi:MAG: 3'-5' exonuclease, partial [Oscillospiraceae bacterium]|nr:3'-5' exonuclease [Oscillospiraceae bacterium]